VCRLPADASYQDYGDLRIILGVIVAMAAAVLVIVCVVHRRRRRARLQQRKSAERRRLSAADAIAADAAVVDGGADCVRDGGGAVEVRYVGRSNSCTPSHPANASPADASAAAGNSVSRTPASTLSRADGISGGAGKRLLKEKTEKVSIV